MGIVVIGAVFVDVKGYPLTKYIPGGRNVGWVQQIHGGVCRNVAEDIANIELRPTMISIVDESGISQDVIDKLNRHQVDTSYVRKVPGGLGTWLAVFDNSGDVIASISQRPDLFAIGQILDEHGDEIVQNADSVVVEIDMEPALLKQIFRLADQYGKKVYAVVSNMSIAMERRDLLQRTGCIVCNEQEAGMLFSEDLEGMEPNLLSELLAQKIGQAGFPQMVVTMGERGAVYAVPGKEHGFVPPQKVEVVDTTGCGDAFFAGVAIGLTYGKELKEACEIGTRLASSVIATKENVCPRFRPQEFEIEPPSA